MHLAVAVWLYFSCFNLQLEFTTVSRKEPWDDLLPRRNLIFSVRYYRWGVRTDTTTLCSVCTLCVRWHLLGNTFFFSFLRNAHPYWKINNKSMCDKWAAASTEEHKEWRTKLKRMAGLFSCLKQIDHSNLTVCSHKCDRQRLVFHGHFVCLCAIMAACISERAHSQSQMKLISIKPFQIRRADGKRTAFERPWCIPRLPDQHEYLFSCDATWECIIVTVPLTVNCGYLPSDDQWPRETSAILNMLGTSKDPDLQ